MPALLSVFLGGAIGSTLRYIIIRLVTQLSGSHFPYGTVVVNSLGCLLMGVVWGYLESTNASQWIKLLIITGGLGAFTTFSTYMVDFVTLAERQQLTEAFSYFLGSNVLGLLLLFLGKSLIK